VNRPTVHCTATPDKDPIFLHKPPSHSQSLGISDTHRIINHLLPSLEIRCDTVNPNSLNNSINLTTPPRPLPLLDIKHNPVDHSIKKTTPLRISQDNRKSRQQWLQESRHPRNGPARASARYKRINAAPTLGVQLWTSTFVVGAPVSLVLELVGEKATATGHALVCRGEIGLVFRGRRDTR
jgi:hypothetical protein